MLPLRVGGSEGGRNGDATAVGSHLLVGSVRTHKIHKVDSFRNQCDETLLDLGSCCLSTGLQDTGVLCGCVSTPQEIMAQFCYRFRQGLLPSALAHMSTSQFPWMRTWCRPKFLCIMESTKVNGWVLYYFWSLTAHESVDNMLLYKDLISPGSHDNDDICTYLSPAC